MYLKTPLISTKLSAIVYPLIVYNLNMKILLVVIFLMFSSCAHNKIGIYTGVGLGTGGGKNSENYEFSDNGISGAIYFGLPTFIIPKLSVNIRGDKVWMGDEIADIETGSLNLRYEVFKMLSIETGYAWGSFWRKMGPYAGGGILNDIFGINSDDNCAVHEGRLQGGHIGVTLHPLNFIFQLGLEANYFFLKSTKEHVSVSEDGVNIVNKDINNGNSWNMWSLMVVSGITF
jgi:hypothetical protein